MKHIISPSRHTLAATATLLALEVLAAAPADARMMQQLVRVPIEQVCMVNDEFMAKKQIPIRVGKKTYYGCCAMCVSTLTSDARARQAVDPVSGHIVDKATAVIGALPDGRVLYFENEANFVTWQQKESRK